ncbi:MAG TPA: ATP-binding cassette domain-containing protein [Anaeromyxobacter sp.]|nr:ATP-binding cassette domain-containing protein [Anaeromyxobacter sp.]
MTHGAFRDLREASEGRQSELPVEMIGISRRFGGVRAQRGVGLRIPTGSVHARMGENGAGKSTRVKILMGVTLSDAGELRPHGKRLLLGGPIHLAIQASARLRREVELPAFTDLAPSSDRRIESSRLSGRREVQFLEMSIHQRGARG